MVQNLRSRIRAGFVMASLSILVACAGCGDEKVEEVDASFEAGVLDTASDRRPADADALISADAAAGDGDLDTADASEDAGPGIDAPADTSEPDAPAADAIAAEVTPPREDAAPPACGAPGMPCCPDRSCAAGGCCATGTAAAPRCLAAGAACPARGGMCTAGRCADCGTLDKPCCSGNLCYDGGQTCISGLCKGCGGLAQPTCPGNACTTVCLNGDGVCVGGGNGCGQNAGTCTADGSCVRDGVACGGLMQRCCGVGTSQGPFCSKPGTTCITQPTPTCLPCGQPGQPCCNASSCREGVCTVVGGRHVCR